jgi:two-component system, chemotaxis family, protein-glutamate methylesterase/glutaminase
MPQNAIERVKVDHIVTIPDIAPLLVRLTSTRVPAGPRAAVSDHNSIEVKIAMEENPIDAGLERIGEPSPFACPECHGVLLELKEGPHARFRCHTGHAYSSASLLAAVNEQIEATMWSSIRSLEEGQLLLCRMADHFKTAHKTSDADELIARADEVKRQSDVIRTLVTSRASFPLEPKQPK